MKLILEIPTLAEGSAVKEERTAALRSDWTLARRWAGLRPRSVETIASGRCALGRQRGETTVQRRHQTTSGAGWSPDVLTDRLAVFTGSGIASICCVITSAPLVTIPDPRSCCYFIIVFLSHGVVGLCAAADG